MNALTDSAAGELERADGLLDQALAASLRYALAHYAKSQVLRAEPIRGGYSRIW